MFWSHNLIKLLKLNWLEIPFQCQITLLRGLTRKRTFGFVLLHIWVTRLCSDRSGNVCLRQHASNRKPLRVFSTSSSAAQIDQFMTSSIASKSTKYSFRIPLAILWCHSARHEVERTYSSRHFRYSSANFPMKNKWLFHERGDDLWHKQAWFIRVPFRLIPKEPVRYGGGFICSFYLQIHQEPRKDSECLSNIKEFVKGCALYHVEVSGACFLCLCLRSCITCECYFIFM